MHLREVLIREARRNANRKAFIYGDKSLTFFQLKERASRLANGLAALGLGKGDHVGILLYNRFEYPEILWANFLLGSVAVTLNFRLVSDEIVYAQSVAKLKALITSEEFLPRIEPIKDDLQGIEHYICLGEGTHNGVISYSELLAKASASVPHISADDRDPAVVLFTSGTAAFPKAVVLTHQNLITAGLIWAADMDIRYGDNCLVVTPFYHIGAVGYHLAHAISGACTTCFPQQSWDPELFLKVVERERCTYLYITPGMYRQVFSVPGFHNYDLSSWRTCITGSEPVPRATIEEMVEHLPQGRIYNAYGLTEATGPTVAVAKDDLAISKAPSVGRPFLNTDVMVVNESGQECMVGEIGEIVVRGDQVMKEYLNDPEMTQNILKDGWLYTGDLGVMDDDGCLYVVDRKKDIIISGGENISSVEVESVLYKHPKIMEAAVIGIPDPKFGEGVCAVVVPREGEALSEQEVVEYCKQHLASYKKPRKVIFTDALPRNPSGKVLKRELRKTYAGSEKMVFQRG
ncbi:MAG: long-chain fatty acid--CoA ligase [Thermoplasmata archaeon]|nr:MAG: long-chain fatty acid--CoA ligase [Thermoplasmata archaeon]